MAKGPQLTQRKIDKLRDALNVVIECDQIQELNDYHDYKTALLDARAIVDSLRVELR